MVPVITDLLVAISIKLNWASMPVFSLVGNPVFGDNNLDGVFAVIGV